MSKISKELTKELNKHIRNLSRVQGPPEFKTTLEGISRPFEDIDPLDRRLDSIARLITGSDTCAAIWFDGASFVASNNTKNSALSTAVFAGLQEVLVGHETGIDGIAIGAYHRLKDTVIVGSIDAFDRTFALPKFNKEFEKLQQLAEANPSNSDLQQFCSTIDSLRDPRMHQEDKIASYTASLESIDGLVASGALDRNPFFKNIAEFMRNQQQDLMKVVDSLTNDDPIHKPFAREMRTAIREGHLSFLNAQPRAHAEMEITQAMVDRRGTGRKEYIGVSKLCCTTCKVTIDELNKYNRTRGDATEIETRGFHGKAYPGWETPRFVIDNPALFERIVNTLGELDSREERHSLRKDAADKSPYPSPERGRSPVPAERGISRAAGAGYAETTTIIAKGATSINTAWWREDQIATSLRRQVGDRARVLDPVASMPQLTISITNNIREDGTYILPLNTNAVNGSFEERNHYASLIITRTEGAVSKIQYIDPMGRSMNEGIKAQVQSSCAGEAAAIGVEEPVFRRPIQIVREDRSTGDPILEGNTYDCGPMMCRLTSCIIKREELPTVDGLEGSKALGQQLRGEERAATAVVVADGLIHSSRSPDRSTAAARLVADADSVTNVASPSATAASLVALMQNTSSQTFRENIAAPEGGGRQPKKSTLGRLGPR